MAGAAVFEVVLTMILAALTAGAAAIAVAGSKARLISTFSKVGALLRKFAQAARKLKIQSRNRKAKGKTADFKDLETIEAEPKKSSSGPSNTAKASVPESVPMSQEKYDEIINLEAGNRPEDVGEYLPKDYIDAHLDKFNQEGGAFVVIEDWIDNPSYKSFPKDGKFVGLSSEMDNVIRSYKESGNDWKVLRDELNLGENVDLSSTRISYVKIEPGDPRFQYSIPTGNEKGAYPNEWVPGGLTKSGTREATMSGGDIINHDNNIDNLNKVPGLNVEQLQ